jgi:hypothetical protein
MEMKIIIGNKLYIEDMPGRLVDRVSGDLTLRNPEYVKRERRGLWLGNTERDLTLMFIYADGVYSLPRGYYGKLMSHAKESNTPVSIADKRQIGRAHV